LRWLPLVFFLFKHFYFFLNQKKFLPLYLLLAVENMMTTLADEGGDKDCSWIFPWYLLSEKTHEECSTAMLNKESRVRMFSFLCLYSNT
jgi:hypothetical protein